MSKVVGYSIVLMLVAVATVCLQDAIASPAPPRAENMALNAKALIQPEYMAALAKELEKEDGENPVVAMWWPRIQQSRPTYTSSKSGNLDQIGGGNLLRRRNLDQIGGANLIKRNLDQIGGGNLLRRSLPADYYYDD